MVKIAFTENTIIFQVETAVYNLHYLTGRKATSKNLKNKLLEELFVHRRALKHA